MPLPNFQKFMLPVLKQSALGEVRMSDIKAAVAKELGLAADDLQELVASGSKTIFDDRIAWAKAYLKQAGLVAQAKRGVFHITDEGKAVLATRPLDIDVKYLEGISRFVFERERQRNDAAAALDEPAAKSIEQYETKFTPQDGMRNSHALMMESLAQELLEGLRTASPAFFERVVVDLLLAMGYGGGKRDAGKITGRSGDNGIDGVIDQDALGLDRVYIQAKRYGETNSVGPEAIHAFYGSLDMHKAAKGLFVTTSAFTKSAKDTAERLGKRIVLIDGRSFSQLMIRFNVWCRIEEIFEVKKIVEEFFE